MKEELFWKIIEAFEWGKDRDTARVSNEMTVYFEEERAAISDQFYKALTDLALSWHSWTEQFGEWVEPHPEVLTTFKPLHNCLLHIVLCGRRQYYQHLNNPRKIYDKLENGRYSTKLNEILQERS